jgi:hypothetical protein
MKNETMEMLDTGSLGPETGPQDLFKFLTDKLDETPNTAIGAACANYKPAGNRVMIVVLADPTVSVDTLVHAFDTQLERLLNSPKAVTATHEAPEKVRYSY